MRLINFLILVAFLNLVFPWPVFALNQLSEKDVTIEELLIKLARLTFLAYDLQRQIEEWIEASLPYHHLQLGDYLETIFEAEGIKVSKSDFLYEVEEPYLEYAKLLGFIPASYKSSTQISKNKAEKIVAELTEVKDKILKDGLFGKIDIHEHYRTGGNLEEFLRASGSLGVGKVVFLPTGWAPDNRGYKIYQAFLLEMQKLYPDRIIAFCTLDEEDSSAAKIFEDCLKAGGKGLKLIGGHPDFYDEPLDSENMYRVYRVAQKWGVPVLIHASIINLPELKEQIKRVFADFPDVTFIHAHYCSTIFNGINLSQCAEILDEYPNVYIDLTMGGGIARYHRYFKQDIGKVKDFILEYQDRILFGSDIILDGSPSKGFDFVYDRMRCDIDLQEKEEYTCSFGEKDWLHQGFQLDQEILEKLYYSNPAKVLGL